MVKLTIEFRVTKLGPEKGVEKSKISLLNSSNFSELETRDDGRVRQKLVVKRKNQNNNLHSRRKYII
jgi:hypothetical protein